jgi:ribosomal protein L18E
MPLQRRIPKRGFTNINRVEHQVVNVRDLGRLEAGEVTPQVLYEKGLIGTLARPVKILGMGDVTDAFQISAHAFSGTAREKIESAGGTVTVLGQGGAKSATQPDAAVQTETVSEEVSDSEESDEASEAADDQA